MPGFTYQSDYVAQVVARAAASRGRPDPRRITEPRHVTILGTDLRNRKDRRRRALRPRSSR